jgi:ATP-dependent 26S proteasome regulatory subunit
MIARAIAKEANATFIPIKASSINQKYVGEGEKMISAVFSLARKLAPSGSHISYILPLQMPFLPLIILKN